MWWFGEGLGGVLSGAASPLNGAPGAVIIYALLAVLLWPADREVPAPFTAARAVGAHVARALWAVLWLSLAYFALTPANRAPQARERHDRGHGERRAGLAAATCRRARRRSSASQGLAASVVLAVALVLIAVGVYLPARIAKATLVLAIVVAAFIWVFAQALGGILAGGGDRRQLRSAARPARARLLAAADRSGGPGDRARGQRRARDSETEA